MNETFRRNEAKAFFDDIFKRTLNISDNEITIQFHYGNNDIRPTIRKYKIPPKPDYGNQITFNEQDNPIDEVNSCESLCAHLENAFVRMGRIEGPRFIEIRNFFCAAAARSHRSQMRTNGMHRN